MIALEEDDADDDPLPVMVMTSTDACRIADRAYAKYTRDQNTRDELAAGKVVDVRGMYISRMAFRVLETIRSSWERIGRGPTKAEIAAATGLQFPTVNGQIEALRELGLVEGQRQTLREAGVEVEGVTLCAST